MELGIQFHLAGLSLSDTISMFDKLGVDRCRSTVHNWIQKADLQPREGLTPDYGMVGEIVIQLNDNRFWLYGAVDAGGHLTAALSRTSLRFRITRHGNRNAVERVFREVKRRTSLFSNTYRNAEPTTAESWLRAFAVCWYRCLSYHDRSDKLIPCEGDDLNHSLAVSALALLKQFEKQTFLRFTSQNIFDTILISMSFVSEPGAVFFISSVRWNRAIYEKISLERPANISRQVT